MRSFRPVALLLLLTFVTLAVPMSGIAQEAPLKVILTFSQPIALPGMVLGPGTYMFKATGADARTLQVLDARGERLYATVLTTSTHVSTEAPRTTVTFDSHAGAPRILKSLVPANQKVGRELVY